LVTYKQIIASTHESRMEMIGIK